MKMAKETWLQSQCQEVEACLKKNNSKKAYQLVKDLTTKKQGKSTTIQDKSGNCLTEENEILNRWTEYCSDLYNYETDGDPIMLDCPQIPDEEHHLILREDMEYNINASIIRVIEYLYDKDQFAVLFNGSTGEWFRTTVGVRQGCLLSPTLFNIFLERIMCEALDDHEGSVSIG